MKKAIKWIVIVVLLVIIVGVVVLLMNLNGIIRSTVETQASKQLNVSTKLAGVNLSLLGGDLDLENFTLGSPKGFTAPEMFSLGKAKVDTSYGELRQDPIHVTSILLDKPKLVIEQSGQNINFKALIDQMEKGEPAPQPTDKTEGKPVKLVIDQLNINGTEVVLMYNLPGLGTGQKNLTLPNIQMTNIGNDDKAKNGAAIKDVVTQVLGAITEKASESDQIPPELQLILKGNLSAVADQIKTQATARVNEELGKLGDKHGVNATQAIESLKTGNPDDLKKTGTDLLKGFGQKKENKPTTAPSVP